MDQQRLAISTFLLSWHVWLTTYDLRVSDIYVYIDPSNDSEKQSSHYKLGDNKLPFINNTKKVFVTGGAGFIGSHLVNRILDTTDGSVTVFDNFSTGRRFHFGERVSDPRLTILEGDAKDQASLI